jgi:hypothetical protein
MADKPICAFCGAKATALCDYKIGLDEAKPIKYNLFFRQKHADQFVGAGNEDAMATCDTPLCSECAKVKSSTHVNARPRHYWITEDWCPIHQAQHSLEIMTFDAIQWWRVEYAAMVRRSRIELLAATDRKGAE